MSFLDSAPDPQKVRALKFFLVVTLAVGALAAAMARPLPVAIAPWLITPLWTLTYGLMRWRAGWRGSGRGLPPPPWPVLRFSLPSIWSGAPGPCRFWVRRWIWQCWRH